MKETMNTIKTNSKLTIRSFATFILSLLITLGSIILFILQILATPFCKLIELCCKTSAKYKLVEPTPDTTV